MHVWKDLQTLLYQWGVFYFLVSALPQIKETAVENCKVLLNQFLHTCLLSLGLCLSFALYHTHSAVGNKQVCHQASST